MPTWACLWGLGEIFTFVYFILLNKWEVFGTVRILLWISKNIRWCFLFRHKKTFVIHLGIKPVAWEVRCRVLFGSVWQGQKCGTWWSCSRLERSNWAIHFGRGLGQMRFHLPYWLRLTVMHSVGNDSRQKWCLKSGVSLRLWMLSPKLLAMSVSSELIPDEYTYCMCLTHLGVCPK